MHSIDGASPSEPRRDAHAARFGAAGWVARNMMKRSAPWIGLVIAGCATPTADRPVTSVTPGPTSTIKIVPPGPAEYVAPSASVAKKPPSLEAPTRSRSWAELKRQAALRVMAANPSGTYDGPAPNPLLAIPVLEVELHADGSIKRIEVLRQPREAKDTLQLAADAVRRAAPFGEVSHLPKPWKFVETFLFNDERKFKPRSLDP